MKTINKIQILMALCFMSIAGAQVSEFNKEVNKIKQSIDSITIAEKALLKEEIKKIEAMEDKSRVAELKAKAAEEASRRIEEKVNAAKEKLNIIITRQVNRAIKQTPQKRGVTVIISSDTIFSSELKRGRKTKRYSKRDRGGLNFAIGFHNVNGSFQNKIKLWGSKSVEVGYSRNFRVLKNNNLLHLNYGLSLVVDKLKMKGNDYFVNKEGITEIKPYKFDLNTSKFKTTFLTFPLNLEVDFTPSYKRKNIEYYPIKNDFRFGVGGYVGVLLGSKQVLKYQNDMGECIRSTDKGEFNVNQWIYGVSAHLGYGTTVIYAKYTLTPLFENNAQHNYPFSIGIRFGG